MGNKRIYLRAKRSFERNEAEMVQNRGGDRVTISVRGCRFETLKRTLDEYPESLLGCEKARLKYYDPTTKEITLDRNEHLFDYILFYYQSKGILSKPEWASQTEFDEELEFFKLKEKPDPPNEKKVKKEPRRNESIKNGYKEPIWRLLQYPESSRLAGYFAKFNLFLIILSTAIYCLETIEQVKKDGETIFFVLESTCVSWYTTEYLFRIITAPSCKKFALSPLGIIDVLSILPFYITLIGNKSNLQGMSSFAVFRFVRLVRVIRVLKLSRYNKGLRVLAKTLLQSNDQVKSLLICIMIVIILASTCMYYVEGFGRPNSSFCSIPHSFWFTIITITSVGYGDMVPLTTLGKMMASFWLISGIILLLSLPVPVLISNFIQFYKDSAGNNNAKIDKQDFF